MTPAVFDLAARRPVWGALASMFLDTDVALARSWRAGVLAASPYSADELDEILITEVYPICWSSLNSGDGERVIGDPALLEAMILQRESSPEILVRLIGLARLAIPRSSEWQATKVAVAALRRVNADADDRADGSA